MNVMYQSLPERELIKMWQDIEGGNVEGVCDSLMKAIANNETDVKIGAEDPLYMMRMLNTETWQWVPFNMLDAYSIVNDRDECLVVQIWRPTDKQPKYGPTLKGWHRMDTSYLNKALKDKKEKFDAKSWREMIQKEKEYWKYEGYPDEYTNSYKNRRI